MLYKRVCYSRGNFTNFILLAGIKGFVLIKHEDCCAWSDWSNRTAADESGSSARTLRHSRRQKPGKSDDNTREPQGNMNIYVQTYFLFEIT